MERAYKTKLVLNNTERTKIRHCCDVARFVYNWALADRKNAWEQRQENVGYNDQKKCFNAMKAGAFPWLLDVPYRAVEYAFRDLDTAYKNFFRRVKAGTEAPGFPRFKSRHDSRQSFSVLGVKIANDKIRLPNLGWFRLEEIGYIPTDIEPGRVTVSVIADEWYVSVQMDAPIKEKPARTDDVIGVDIGHGVLATLNTGQQYQNPRVLDGYEKRLARLQRELSRREKGGKNRAKTKAGIAKLHAKIARVRVHGIHAASRDIVDQRPKTIAVEGFDIRQMMEDATPIGRKYARRNRKMADAAAGEFRRQLKYKQEWAGGTVFVAGKDEPTNRKCNACGHVNGFVPLVEEFTCAGCGAKVNRRLNTAKNVIQLAIQA
jgi:putative transposase